MKIKPKEWEDRLKFAIVRNPFERLVSLYGLFRKRHAGNMMELAKDDHKLSKFFAAFDHADIRPTMRKKDQRKLYKKAVALSFSDWLAFCEKYNWNNCRYLDGRRPMVHIQQYEWFKGLDRIFRFEDLAELNGFLVERGYDAIKQENKSSHEPWQSYYDDELHNHVALLFRDDIERFAYGG